MKQNKTSLQVIIILGEVFVTLLKSAKKLTDLKNLI